MVASLLKRIHQLETEFDDKKQKEDQILRMKQEIKELSI